MTYAGAFEYFRTGQTWKLLAVTQAGHDQVTGARVNATTAEADIKGALDATTEEDLRLYGAEVIKEGVFQFHTEESFGLNGGDLIKQVETGKLYKVLQRKHSAPNVRARMDPTADMVTFYVEATRRGTSP